MAQDTPSLIQGSITRALLTLAIPIVFANLLQTAYQLTDTFWVGRLGADAVAAVSLSFPVLFFLISLGIGLAVAGTILVAQNKGRGDLDAVNHVAAQALMGVIALSLLLAAIGYFIAAPLVAFLGASASVQPHATSYLQVSFLGLPFMFAYVIFQSLMRGVGDVKTPLLIVAGTVLLNFGLDPLLILGYGPVPALGVSGAAAATLATQGLAAMIGLFMLFSGRYGIQLARLHMRPDLPMLWQLFRLGLPAAVEQATRALGLMLMTILVAGFGTVALAAYGIGSRMLSFVIIPALGLSQATSTVVGQNVGAGQLERAEHTTYLSGALALTSLTLVGVVSFFLAAPLVELFVPGEVAVIEEGARFVRITALSYGLLGAQIVVTGAFRGSGNTLAAMAIALISLWVLQFPIAWLLTERTQLGVAGVWISYPVQAFLSALVAWVWFKRGTWKQKNLVGRTPEETKVAQYPTDTVMDTNGG